MNDDIAYEMRIVRGMLQKRKQQLDLLVAASKKMLKEFKTQDMHAHQRSCFDEVERVVSGIETDSL